MPYFKHSAYKSPSLYKNGHLSTIYSGGIKSTTAPNYQREKLELSDGDFIFIDYYLKNTKKAIILCHGLAGSSQSSYINTSSNYFLQHHYSVFAWNNRSCGGAINRLPQLYHHASVNDLEAVVQAVLKKGFEEIYLLGFSLGGAQIMNYFGRKKIDPRLKAGAAISTPINLKSSAQAIEKGMSRIYADRFIKKIRQKIVAKAQIFPKILPVKSARKINSFEELARQFIVPVHGFDNLEDYYEKASPSYSMKAITTPVLVLNAQRDPIIGESYPVAFAKNHDFVYLETPKYGGHCGFPLVKTQFSYAEIRSLAFFEKQAIEQGSHF